MIAAIKKDDDKTIADLIRSMARLWPDTLGLRRRRLAEAALIDQADAAVAESDILKNNCIDILFWGNQHFT